MSRATRATIAVLSADGSRFLPEVLSAAAASMSDADELVLVWSGRQEAPRLAGVQRTMLVQPDAFDHGGTRWAAAVSSNTEFIAYLSDDATPASGEWLNAMVGGFADARVGAVYGRHSARVDAPIEDRAFRDARYPTRSGDVHLDARGLLPAIAPVSNANAAYRISALRAIGGIPAPCSFAEDRETALRLLRAGWRVRYEAAAEVRHTHYHSWRQTLDRGRAAVSFTLFAGGVTGVWDLAQFAGRSARSAWDAGGIGGLISVGRAIGLRTAGLIGARLRRS